MTDLITKLETAESGSRELSDEVLKCLDWKYQDTGIVAGGQCVWLWCDPGGSTWSYVDLPSPSESVDDALGLVPEGYWLRKLAEFEDGCRATLVKLNKVPNGNAATFPLAICAAILRAQNKE